MLSLYQTGLCVSAVVDQRGARQRQVMGYEVTRFEGEVDEELLCPICSGVLEDPVQVLYVSD